MKRLTFHDLWNKGFFITEGTKFGGDFLAYPGDPIQFHAKYVVICCDTIDNMSERDLVAKSRLGTNVKKTVLLAFLDSNQTVRYKSLKWSDQRGGRKTE